MYPHRQTSSKHSSKPPNSTMWSQYGRLSSQRYRAVPGLDCNGYTDRLKALEGKNVKDMLLNVGSGGGGAAAAAPSGGAATSGGAGDAPAAKEEEKKEEGKIAGIISASWIIFTHSLQRRKSQTRIWASVCLIKRLHTIPFPCFCQSTRSKN